MTETLTLDMASAIPYLYQGAETMFNALAGPYLLIAGFSFGLAILGAIVRAIRVRM